MEVLKAFLLVGLGIALDALHNKIRRDSERIAFGRGYKQGMREAENKMVRLDKEPDHPERVNAEIKLPESFEHDLKTKGRAVTRIRKGEQA